MENFEKLPSKKSLRNQAEKQHSQQINTLDQDLFSQDVDGITCGKLEDNGKMPVHISVNDGSNQVIATKMACQSIINNEGVIVVTYVDTDGEVKQLTSKRVVNMPSQKEMIQSTQAKTNGQREVDRGLMQWMKK